jgi:hypothetical protein
MNVIFILRELLHLTRIRSGWRGRGRGDQPWRIVSLLRRIAAFPLRFLILE